MKNINQKIKSKITTVHPNPKWQVYMHQAFLDALLIASWFFAVIIIGMIIYILAHYNPWENLPNGFLNFLQAVEDLPWEMFFILSILILVIYLTSRQAYLIYRLNSLFILFFIIGSVAVGYFIAEKVGLHDTISQNSIIKEIYLRQGKLFLVSRGTVITGEITGAKDSHIIIKDSDDTNWFISFDKNTNFTNGRNFQINEIIKINGIKESPNHIKAISIQKIDATWRGFFDAFENRSLLPCNDCNIN